MIKRSDIRGWTLRFGSYWLEYVSVKHIPAVLCLSRRGLATLFRIER